MIEAFHSPRFLHILDTSAVRSIKSVQIQEIRERVKIAISPYTVLELLAHLSTEDFLRYKSELAKLQDIPILMFPRSQLPGLQNDKIDRSHWNSLRDAMPAILCCVLESNSYSQFSCLSVPFGPRDKMLSLSDLGSRVKQDLASLKKGYSSFIEEVIEDLTGYESSSLKTPDEQQFVIHAKNAMRPGLEALIATNPGVDEGEYHDRLYPYFSFLILRALKYAQKHKEARHIKIDENDYVDSYLCLHLDLQAPCTLVTQDKSLRRDLAWTLNSIRVAHAYTPKCSVVGIASLFPSEPTA